MKKLKKRSFAYWYYKILKEKGTPDFIARGLATGLFVNFFMPSFFRKITAIPLAFLFRGSRIAAFAGTFITNTITISFIYPAQCYIGGYLIYKPLHYEQIKTVLNNIIQNPSFDEIFQLGKHLMLAFFAGGAFLGIIAAIPGYFIAYRLVEKYQKKRYARRMQRQQATLDAGNIKR